MQADDSQCKPSQSTLLLEAASLPVFSRGVSSYRLLHACRQLSHTTNECNCHGLFVSIMRFLFANLRRLGREQIGARAGGRVWRKRASNNKQDGGATTAPPSCC